MCWEKRRFIIHMDEGPAIFDYLDLATVAVTFRQTCYKS